MALHTSYAWAIYGNKSIEVGVKYCTVKGLALHALQVVRRRMYQNVNSIDHICESV
jgi:hypothetical protein